MIEKLAKRIAKSQIKTPYLFIFSFLLITLILLPGMFRLMGNVEPSLEKVLPQDIEEIKTMEDMRSQFGADMMYLVVYSAEPVLDVRTPQFLKYVDALTQKIKTNPSILEVTSLVDEIKIQNQGVLPTSLAQAKSLKISNQFVNADYSLTVIQVKTDTGSSAKKINYVIDSINADIDSLKYFNPGAKIDITGFNAIDKATFDVILSDFGSITVLSMGLVFFIVFLTFKSVKKAMLPMVVVIIALLWTMGISGYLNLTITVVSMVSAAMIMGLGIDFGIHVVHSFFENRKTMNGKLSLIEMLKELLRAMVGASLTTMAGFLALLFGVLPAMKTLAIILALGILNTLLGAVLLLPAIIYVYDRRSNKNEFN